ncbi:MAG: D-alanyl-D-alanine carboxypeptidase, partial [Bacteroidia bacterium]|nr:D-alanyl-D-alanine carboxypeptidase [Bacteroidia bacterium]
MRNTLILLLIFSFPGARSQPVAFESFLADSVMTTATVSFLVSDAESGDVVFSHNKSTSLIPASTMKLVTSAAAIELLGPTYTFKTTVGYTGSISRAGRLNGDIIISGGGDPSLGSDYFREHYGDFINGWVEKIKKAGIKKIKGKVITD